MARKLPSAVPRYGLALLSFALVMLLSFGVQRLFSLSLDLTSLIIGVMIASAWYGGRGPGLLIAVLFELTLDYFYAGPYTFTVRG